MLQIQVTGDIAEDVSQTVVEVVAKLIREGHSVLYGNLATYAAHLIYRQPSGNLTPKGNEIMDEVREEFPIRAGDMLFMALSKHDHAPTILVTSKIVAE